MANIAVATPGNEPTLYITIPDELDAKRLADLAEHESTRRADIISRIKLIAHRKIVNVAPEYKQRNMLNRMIELRESGYVPTAQDLIEIDKIKALWQRIKALQAHSNDLEQQFKDAGMPLDFNFRAGWPE